MLSAMELIHCLQTGRYTCTQVLDAYISRQKEVNSLINAVVFDRYTAAKQEAASIDQRIQTARQKGGSDAVKQLWSAQPLLGIPFTVKECFAVQDCPNCAGLVSRASHRAARDAEIVQRMKASGVICIGLTNLGQLCVGLESTNCVYGSCSNPYDVRRTAGGTSGGEGAIIGAGGSVAGLGSDIAGSIRIPAHYNGIFGHKPTRGLLPADGEFPPGTVQSNSFKQAGPMCRYAEDLRPFLIAMAGPEVTEQCKLHQAVNIDHLKDVEFLYMEDLGDSIFTSPLETDIRQGFQKVVNRLRAEGCSVTEVTHLDRMKNATLYWQAKMALNSTSNFADLMTDGQAASYSPVQEMARWLLGRSPHTLAALSYAMLEPLAVSQRENNQNLCEQCDILREQFLQLFTNGLQKPSSGSKYRVFLLPTCPTTAPYHSQSFCGSFNFAYPGIFNVLGFPATSVPIGFDSRKLPFGIQIVANFHEDTTCLAVACRFEKLFGGWVQPACA